MPRNYLCFPSKQVDHLVRLGIFIFAALDLGLFGGMLIPLILAGLCLSSFAPLRKIISRKGANALPPTSPKKSRNMSLFFWVGIFFLLLSGEVSVDLFTSTV
jgi:hypothetical protein